MVYCSKCGTQIEEGKTFCSSCGAVAEEGTMQQDIEQHKAMGILAYFGPLVLIPIFAAPGSKFARYHSNQGLVLLLTEIIYSIVYSILSSVILAISWRLYFIVSIIGLVSIVFLVLAVIGILNAANGKLKELPVIGKIRLLK